MKSGEKSVDGRAVIPRVLETGSLQLSSSRPQRPFAG